MKINKSVLTLSTILVFLVIGSIAALATGAIRWGGEKDMEAIYEAVDRLDDKLTAKEVAINTSKDQIGGLNTKLVKAENELNKAKNEVNDAKNQLILKDQAAENKQIELKQKENEIQDKIKELSDKDIEIQNKINEGNDKVAQKQKEVDSINEQLSLKQQEVNTLTKEVENLQIKVDKLEYDKYADDERLHQALEDVKILRDYVERVDQQHN